MKLPGILFITSYPPRECGIATYSQDLIKGLNNKFNCSFNIQICPLESDTEKHAYPDPVPYILNTDHPDEFYSLAIGINKDPDIQMIMIQHEFGFFEKNEATFNNFLIELSKPIITVFHTVLPGPDDELKEKVQQIFTASESIVVMTQYSEQILCNDYQVHGGKIIVIPHGTHLVPHTEKEQLKNTYHLSAKNILATFGFLSSGKSIESTLHALPSIVKSHPDVLFLIIGKTHPSILKKEGEKYRNMLESTVKELQLEPYVKFINQFLPLPELLDYLQLTDIYLFTSKDPNQAVSGTFSYAISCGCPIISTPIPHAREVLENGAGIIIDFENSTQLATAAIYLLDDENLRKNISSNGLHKMASTAWENSAIAHARLFEKISADEISLCYNLPVINLKHVKRLTTDIGIIQFSKINHPDISSGYTLDDNARAMIAMCMHLGLTKDQTDLPYIRIYLDFIQFCQLPEGGFLNYVDEQSMFTEQNYTTNLADSNGRALWALGYLISMRDELPEQLIEDAESIFEKALLTIKKMHSTRAMAFAIKGLYNRYTCNHSEKYRELIQELADRLVQMYRHEADENWDWYESYLTYANSILPEAILLAWLATGNATYKIIAKSTFDFLLVKTFNTNNINVISNKGWLQKMATSIPKPIGGEQPIDVAYTILALRNFYEVFRDDTYLRKMETSFNWFLGSNHLHQIIYNPCTGGCYDGLEEKHVNLNQGAESTLSYLLARLTLEEDVKQAHKPTPKTKKIKKKYSVL